jgi:hypothetical protein
VTAQRLGAALLTLLLLEDRFHLDQLPKLLPALRRTYSPS